MKKNSLILINCIAIAALTACNLNKEVITVDSADHVLTTTVVQPTQTPPTLVGQWSVIKVDTEDVTATDDEYPTVTFDNNGAAAGTVNMYANDGCNYINGTFTVKENRLIRSGEFTKTMRLCPDAKYEMQITAALNNASAYSIELRNNEYYLLLKDEAGTTLMTLCKPNLAFFDGAWRVTSMEGAEIKTGHAPEIVIDLANGKIHGNAGCNVVNGTIVQNLDREGGIGFSNLFTTMMACPYLDTERAFLVALEQVESCIPGENNNTVQLKDASGKTIITLERINLTQE